VGKRYRRKGDGRGIEGAEKGEGTEGKGKETAVERWGMSPPHPRAKIIGLGWNWNGV